jgi:hypothetical protein
MLQFDPGALRCLGLEANLNLPGHVVIGHDAPLRANVPTEDDADRRLIDKDARPAALGAVDSSVDDVATDPGFEHGLGDWCIKQAVLGRLKVSEPLGEYRERSVDRGVDEQA